MRLGGIDPLRTLAGASWARIREIRQFGRFRVATHKLAGLGRGPRAANTQYTIQGGSRLSASLFQRSALQDAFTALRQDLIQEDGPRISTMRNYRFAIVQYDPHDEFKLRSEVRHLSTVLTANGWM